MTRFSLLKNEFQLKDFLWLNIVAAILYGGSLLLSRIGFPYFVPVIGLLVFFLPALNISLLVWSLARTRETLASLVLWTVLVSLTLVPAAIFVMAGKNIGDVSLTQPLTFNLLWVGSLVGAWLASASNKGSRSFHFSFQPFLTREFTLLLALFLGIIGLNLLLYPYIPERDTYTYILDAKRIAQDPAMLALYPRSIFIVLLELLNHLTKLDLYWIMKIVFPLLSFISVATIYARAKDLLQSRALRMVASLSLFSFPVVLQEVLIPRPQTLFVLCLIPALYLLERLRQENANIRAIYWFLLMILVADAGLVVHFLFMFIVLVAVVAIGMFVWPWIKKQPADSIMILLATATLLFFSRIPFGDIIGDILRLFRILGETIARGHFEWWFIDHYYNVDGIELGWPGITQIYYYLYNLGVLLVPVLIGLIVFRINPLKRLVTRRYWATALLLVVFFFVAEIAPRLGLAYLPDRAWHFVVLLCAVLMPWLLVPIEKLKNLRLITTLMIIAFSASLIVGSALTYFKRGDVSKHEVAAARYVKENTDPRAVFFGQGSGQIFLGYFGDRVFVKPGTEPFLSDDPNAFEKYLENEKRAYALAREGYDERFTALGVELTELRDQLLHEQNKDHKAQIAKSLNKVVEDINAHIKMGPPKAKPFLADDVPLYIIFSYNPFNTIYNQRSWWRAGNLYGANVDKFTQKYPLVYNKEGVLIWEVRK